MYYKVYIQCTVNLFSIINPAINRPHPQIIIITYIMPYKHIIAGYECLHRSSYRPIGRKIKTTCVTSRVPTEQPGLVQARTTQDRRRCAVVSDTETSAEDSLIPVSREEGPPRIGRLSITARVDFLSSLCYSSSVGSDQTG